MADKLNPSESLSIGESIKSQNGRITLAMQGDANLVLYRSNGVAIWDSKTVGTQATQAVMQNDGNLVLYGPTGAIWSTDTANNPGAFLVAQDDENLVIYTPDGDPLWDTNTWVRPAGPVEASKSEHVGSRKRMVTRATLYRNGLLNVNTFSESYHPTEGLTGRVLIICVDDDARAIWVSEEFRCTTRGGRLDFTTPSKGTNNFVQNLPEPVGRYTSTLDIYHSTGPLTDWRARVIQAIKNTADIAREVKNVYDELF
jgi:hypothetical protein